MSNEKQNNWREKLEAVDALPGEPAFDSAAAWDKLQQRLQHKPRRKKTVWYWAAAAAVVLLMGWPLLLKRTNTLLPVNSIVQKKQVDKPVILVLPAKEEPAYGVILSAPVSKQPGRGNSIIRKKHPVTGTVPLPALALLDIIEIPSPATPAATVDSAAGTIAAAKNEKKLPVVHINDLETPAPQWALSPPSGRSRFRIKLSNHQPHQQLAASQKSNDGLINVKISFKN